MCASSFLRLSEQQVEVLRKSLKINPAKTPDVEVSNVDVLMIHSQLFTKQDAGYNPSNRFFFSSNSSREMAPTSKSSFSFVMVSIGFLLEADINLLSAIGTFFLPKQEYQSEGKRKSGCNCKCRN